MVLENFSQSVIPGILQKFIFKQKNEPTFNFPVQKDGDIKNVDVEEIEETRKVDRKKVKKRRRREKRKFVDSSDDIELPKDSELINSEDNIMESDEEFLDLNSAFVTLAVSRKKIHNRNMGIDGNQSGVKDKATKMHDEEAETKYIAAASERLAIQGCRLAAKEHHERAIDMFTKAIELTPGDYRFYGNRSFCYCQLGQYKRALKDAEKAINLAPENPKGYFRKGEALQALNKLKESKDAFEHVLKLDEDCEDARMELRIVNENLEMTSKENSHQSMNYLDSTLSCGGSLSSGGTSPHGDMPYLNRVDSKMDPSNPDGSCSLWIGNISSAVTEQQLFAMFSEYGFVSSVRILPKKFCAFVNFQEATSAGMAMRYLQRTTLCGERILIRFPDNPSLILPKTSPTNSMSTSPSLLQSHRARPFNSRNSNKK